MNKERVCRCIVPPKGTRFEKDRVYKWGYIIDGYYVLDGQGEDWTADLIKLYQHFQIIGKNGEHI